MNKMSLLKTGVCLLFMLSIVSIVLSKDVNNCEKWAADDKLLKRGTVEKKAKLFDRATTEYTYPEDAPTEYTITCVKALDITDDKEGDASIKNGGVDFKTVTIKFQSGVNDPLKFSVLIYGKKED